MEIKEGIINNLLCMSCLCVGRYIQEVKDESLKQYYLDLLKEIPLPINLPSPLLCWECEAVLRRMVAFREQVKDSYRILNTYTKENLKECLQTDISRLPRLKIYQQKSINIPPEDAVKVEADDDKLSQNECSKPDSDIEPEELHTVICDVQRKRKIINNGGRSTRLRRDEQDPMCIHDVKDEPSDDVLMDKMKIEAVDVELEPLPKKERRKKINKIKPSEDIEVFDRNGKDKISNVKIEHCNEIIEGGGKSLDSYSDLDADHQIHNYLEKTKKAARNNKCTKNQYYRSLNLSYEEMQADRESQRKTESYMNASYKCDSCIIYFNSNKLLKEHNEKRHSTSGKYICSICDTNLSSVEEFTSHYRRHMRIYECTVCKKRSATLKDVQQHLLEHNIQVKKYTCDVCGVVSNSTATHRYHKEKHHSNKPRIQCTDCDKTFSHRAGLMNHRLAFHEYQNKFPCNVCNKIFRWKTSLKRHLKKHNESKDSRSKAFCAKCDIVFSSVCSLQRHLRNSLKHVTTDQLKFICDHCNHRFADKTKLRDHIEEKHLFKTYHCQICHKPSKNRVGLEQHIRTVHKGRPNNRMCHHCGKGFPTKVQLESHIRTHTGERPFMCEYCPTTFSQQSNLYKHHRQVHLNIKTKRYPLCKKRKDVTQDMAVFALPVVHFMPENGFTI